MAARTLQFAVGALRVGGPFVASKTCTLGEPCTFSLSGAVFTGTNRVAVLASGGGGCGAAAALAPVQGWTNLRQQSQVACDGQQLCAFFFCGVLSV